MLHGVHITYRLDQEQSWDWNPGPRLQDTGVSNSELGSTQQNSLDKKLKLRRKQQQWCV